VATGFQPFIVGIGGTARPGSTTERAVLAALAAAEQLGARTQMFGGDFLAKLPLYTPEEQTRTPEELSLITAVRAADGLIIGSPAYHGGISGVVKNAIDLIEETSRDERVYLDGRAVGLIVSAYGWQATGTTLTSMRSIVHALRGWPTPLGATINSTGGVFDPDGNIKEPSLANTLAIIGRQVVQFAHWQKS
jgi:FMN reductase